MLTTLRSKLTYANVVATIALFLALGGASYAAITLPKNSVGAPQLKKNSVRGSEVKNRSLGLGEFTRSARSGLRGPQGPQGLQGAPGAPGANGPQGEPGTARAYALIASDGSVNRAKDVTGVSHSPGGVYCFDLPFTPDNAVATAARPGPGSFSLKNVVTTGVAPDLGSTACVAPFTDAVAAVTDTVDATTFKDGAFFIVFN